MTDVAAPNETIDVISKCAFDRNVFGEDAGEIAASTAVMIEMQQRHRRFIAIEWSIAPLATDQPHSVTLFVQSRGQMLGIDSVRPAIRPDILREKMKSGHFA